MTAATERAILAHLEEQAKHRDSQHSDLKGVVESTRSEVMSLGRRMDLREQHSDHLHAAHGSRLDAIEDTAEATGARELVQLTTTIDTWKGRLWSVFAALLLAGVVALVTHYVSTG
jgi:hypothetical protein